ncbi:TraU family protein [Campylobacter sp. MIT 97-5078]|uniref:TraU family protein n=1 Tax=Campylobacter sp. MIT 97-5078 TaxID=1548153 RepID=UPI0005134024|nr:TraU family protein [Campylobacter sp. MIT 97-5078]KGI56053.1 conjugal transfer protein TraU [Campylobacter sp. MIT 97-5078]KGI57483.1 conjugal transfer protein TraU [Campylobacter sp. MIT 97-5078]KGI57488.1 conjugal transfer protein TraU [Campylobacter sp. MIT 97-5078]TQR27412.1 conjugal transfer protein TraU [Campylobacter sp. MIT 97-5078]
MNTKHSILALTIGSFLFFTPSKSESVCLANPAQVVNTMTSICYSCMFPLYMFSVPLIQGPMPDVRGSSSAPICICEAPPPLFIRIGFPIGYFEASRMIDVVKDPFCFTGLGLNMGANLINTSSGTKGDAIDRQRVFYQSHYYIYPLFEILGMFVDLLCLNAGVGIDIAYMTEVDPLWQDDELSALVNPDALLFGNPISHLSCIADATSAQTNIALDPLFWCKGSWGNAYPLTGNTGSKDYVEDAASVAAGMLYKLHRESVLWESSGPPTVSGICTDYPLPIWLKSSYRLQIIAPIPHPMGMAIGQSGLLWSYAKNLPANGDNFSFIIFKKKECCVL